MNKIHQTPEFQVIKQNEANSKFFVASNLPGGSDKTDKLTTYTFGGAWVKTS